MKLSVCFVCFDLRIIPVITHQPRLRLNIDRIHVPIILHILNCSIRIPWSRYSIQCFLISNYHFLLYIYTICQHNKIYVKMCLF